MKIHCLSLFVIDVLFIPLFYCDFSKRYCGQAKCDEFASWKYEDVLFILCFYCKDKRGIVGKPVLFFYVMTIM